MGRAPSEKDGLKKGPWTAEEDQKLIDYIQKNGCSNWRTLPTNAGLQRCGKSCRLRWTNYLRPGIKRGKFSHEEEETIIHLHSVLGNKWSVIAARLPGRTDNEIKNYWNTHIRKKLLKMGIDPVTHRPRLDLMEYLSSILSSSICSATDMNFTKLLMGGHEPVAKAAELQRIASSLLLSNSQNQFPISCQQNFQQTPFFSSQVVQNQLQPAIVENPNCTSLRNISFDPTTFLSTPFEPFAIDQTQQLMIAPNSQLSCSSNFVAEDDYLSLPNYGYYSCNTSEDSSFESNNRSNFSLASVLSTPSSSSTHFNSNSSYVDDQQLC